MPVTSYPLRPMLRGASCRRIMELRMRLGQRPCTVFLVPSRIWRVVASYKRSSFKASCLEKSMTHRGRTYPVVAQVTCSVLRMDAQQGVTVPSQGRGLRQTPQG